MAAAAIGLLIAAPLAVAAQTEIPSSTAPTQFVTYTQEVPCPAGEASHRRRPAAHRRHRPIRRKRVIHASVRRKPHVVVHRARLVRPRPHKRLLVRAADPVRTRRCSVVRRDRLTPASFGIAPESAVLTPVADDVEPGGFATSPDSSGRAAFGQPINPSTGGGGGGGGVGGGGTVISAAPEPDAWALLLVGVGALGLALRRRSRELVKLS